MEIESYNIKLSLEEINSLLKILGRFNDIELESKGIIGKDREVLRDMYFTLQSKIDGATG